MFMRGLDMAYPLPTSLPTQPTPSGSNTEISSDPRGNRLVFVEEIHRPHIQTRMQRLKQSEEAYIKEQIENVLHTMRLSPSFHAASLAGNRVLADSSMRQYKFLFNALSCF
jgi:hypothetical protein